jgi:hypothetical protein
VIEQKFDDLFHPEGDPLDGPPASKTKAPKRPKRQTKLFAQLPVDAFQTLAAHATCPLLAVILELDRLVVTSFGRSNKVNLSNFKLGKPAHRHRQAGTRPDGAIAERGHQLLNRTIEVVGAGENGIDIVVAEQLPAHGKTLRNECRHF